jgi:hypothetical protein
MQHRWACFFIIWLIWGFFFFHSFWSVLHSFVDCFFYLYSERANCCLVLSYSYCLHLSLQVSLVINYDLPNNRELYIHRIGRSGRFGRKVYVWFINFCYEMHPYNMNWTLYKEKTSLNYCFLGLNTLWFSFEEILHCGCSSLLLVLPFDD